MKNNLLQSLKNTLCLLLCAGLLLGCQDGRDGEPGPQGPAGQPGAKGPQGVPGVSGLPLTKAGSITGTVTGQRADGTAINETFNFQYALPQYYAMFHSHGNWHGISIALSDSLRTGLLSFMLETDGRFQNPKMAQARYETRKAGPDHVYVQTEADFRYTAYNSSFTTPVVTGTFSNISYNAGTGMVSGNFNWQVDNASHEEEGYVGNQFYLIDYYNRSGSKRPMRIEGTFSVPLKQRTYRERAGQ